MSKAKYTTSENYEPSEKGCEKACCEKPSQTIPGEAKTVQEIIKRAQAGTPPVENKYPYMDVEDVSRINKFYRPGTLDLTDIEELQKRSNELEDIVKKAVKNKKEAEEKAKKEAKEKAKKEAEEKEGKSESENEE